MTQSPRPITQNSQILVRRLLLVLGWYLCLAGGRNLGHMDLMLTSGNYHCCLIHAFLPLWGAQSDPSLPAFLEEHFQNKWGGPSPCPSISWLWVPALRPTRNGCSIPRSKWLSVRFSFFCQDWGCFRFTLGSSPPGSHMFSATPLVPGAWLSTEYHQNISWMSRLTGVTRLVLSSCRQ